MGNKLWGPGIATSLIFFVKLPNKRSDAVISLENKVFIKKLYTEHSYKSLWKHNAPLSKHKVKRWQSKRWMEPGRLDMRS